MLPSTMRLLLRLVCGFTILASTWLTTMYFFLQHPGYQERAAISAAFVLAGLVTLAALQLARPPAWLLAIVAAGAIAIDLRGQLDRQRGASPRCALRRLRARDRRSARRPGRADARRDWDVAADRP